MSLRMYIIELGFYLRMIHSVGLVSPFTRTGKSLENIIPERSFQFWRYSRNSVIHLGTENVINMPDISWLDFQTSMVGRTHMEDNRRHNIPFIFRTHAAIFKSNPVTALCLRKAASDVPMWCIIGHVPGIQRNILWNFEHFLSSRSLVKCKI